MNHSNETEPFRSQPPYGSIWDCVIIGAGAAGLASATCLAGNPSFSVLVLESHRQPGGCAGFFVRSQPRRFHDAGATQLIECSALGIQNRLFRKATGRDLGPLLQIRDLDHVWLGRGGSSDGSLRVSLNSEGLINLACARESSLSEFEINQFHNLSSFLQKCFADAKWMWGLFYGWPRFPWTNVQDVFHALRLGLTLTPAQLMRAIAVCARSVADEAVRLGLSPGSKAWELLSALLLDTSQNPPENTPYLAGCMGLSILQRGIYRMPRGMADFFVPWAAGVERLGVTVRYGQQVRSIRSSGDLLGQGSGCARRTGAGAPSFLIEAAPAAESGAAELRARSVIFAASVPGLMRLIPEDDKLCETKEWFAWRRAAESAKEWQAVALYGWLSPRGDLQDVKADGEQSEKWGSAATDPWYLQIFPVAGDRIPHALYLSAGPVQRDPRCPNTGAHRVFTATAHIQLGDGSDQARERQFLLAELTRRVEQATGCSVSGTELGMPSTFAKYTGRPLGRVGGPPLGFGTFAVHALPSAVQAVGGGFLALAGDWVFPGQGVVAAGLSGALAASRVIGKPVGDLLP